jgi:transcription antitermination factor NusG
MEDEIKRIPPPPVLREELSQSGPARRAAQWYCIVTQPGCEVRAELSLYAAGFCTFAPKVRRWVSHARTKTAKEKPLLGRYVFVAIDEETQSFDAVRRAHGVDSFVATVGRPIAFPEKWVENFRMRYMAGEWDFVSSVTGTFLGEDGLPTVRRNDLPIGARVELMAGEFADMLATVTGREGKRGKTIVFKLKDENRYSSLNVSDVRPAWDWHGRAA